MYIQYNGGSCVKAYSDAACTNIKFPNPHLLYEIQLPNIGSVEICNEAREARNEAREARNGARNFKISIYLLFIPIAALLQFQYA